MRTLRNLILVIGLVAVATACGGKSKAEDTGNTGGSDVGSDVGGDPYGGDPYAGDMGDGEME